MRLGKKIHRKLLRLYNGYLGKKRKKELESKSVNWGLYTGAKRKEMYVVSMASYDKRYDVLPMALKSLLDQSVKPDKIVVWLDENGKGNHLPAQLEELKEYGVEFFFVNDGLKPHKKYFYALKEYPQANIITVDDDVLYSKDLIESLVQYHNQYPKTICARRVHKITYGQNGKLKPYVDWEYECRNALSPDFDLFATGVGGVLYPAHSLADDVRDIKKIKTLSLDADDVWLKFMELLNQIPVVWVKSYYLMPYEIENSQVVSLNAVNVLEGKNDIFIHNLEKEYPAALEFLYQECEKKK
jgi:hypothetical protein